MIYRHPLYSIYNQQYGSQKPMTSNQDFHVGISDEWDSNSHRDKLRRCRLGQVQELADHQSLAEQHLALSWSKRPPDLESVEVEPDQIQLQLFPDCSHCQKVDTALGLRTSHLCESRVADCSICAPVSANKKKPLTRPARSDRHASWFQKGRHQPFLRR